MQHDLCEHQSQLLHHVRDAAAVLGGCAGLFDVRSIAVASVSDHTATEATTAEAAASFSFSSVDAACHRKILASVGGRHDRGAGLQSGAVRSPARYLTPFHPISSLNLS